jgi:NADPH:quinone reductase-like Zn-dependent oxidoreductase
MRAVVYDRYGAPDVLQVRERPSPVPGPKEVLVSVGAAALNPKDSLIRKGKFRVVTGSNFPRGIGYDLAGRVKAVGARVTRFQAGDAVFGMLNGWAGGTIAEEVLAQEDELAKKPAALSFDEAAGIPLAALTALQALRDDGKLKPGQRVLINGASGGVGVFALQLARALGAHVVSTSSAKNLELCRSLGAHETWDYAEKDAFAAGGGFDLIFDVFGNRRFGAAKKALGARGTFVTTVPSPQAVVLHVLTTPLPKRSRLVVVKSNGADLEQLARFVDEGKLKPVVDRVVPLEQTGAGQAHIETKRARGKVVVHVQDRP